LWLEFSDGAIGNNPDGFLLILAGLPPLIATLTLIERGFWINSLPKNYLNLEMFLV
jgi:hypothetical protein